MFTFEVIILVTLAFFLGSVFNTLLLSRFYEVKAVEEEEKSLNNRGDQTNGLSVIKNLSTKRFFKSIASLILIFAVIAVFVLSYQYELFDNWIALVVLGLFGFYVLTMERTITMVYIPVFKAWKDGAPKRKENKTKRKDKKAQEKKELAKRDSTFPKRPTEVNPPEVKKTAVVVEGTVIDKEEA